MYIKAWRNKMDFTGSAKPRCGRGKEGPCFGVCALVCDFSPKAECVPAFVNESEREPFMREVEKRNEKRFETALWRQLFGAIRGSDFKGKVELFKPDFWTGRAVRF